jgi:hypothetical protein
MTADDRDEAPISCPSARLEKWKGWARALGALGVRESDHVMRRATALNQAPNFRNARALIEAVEATLERNGNSALRAQARALLIDLDNEIARATGD